MNVLCVLYVSFGSKVRPRTFGCVSMGSAVLFILRSRLLLYSAGSGVNLPLVVVVVDLPLLRVAVEMSDNPTTLEQPCQASLPPDQQRHHSLGRHPKVQYIA